jgi:dolichol-phosphate mannosyltransferase
MRDYLLPAPEEMELALISKPHTATIILPAYNEAEALPQVLSALFRVLDDRHEIIVVDDGSTDDTAVIAGQYPCTLIRQRNQGKGAAVRAGIRAATGRHIIVMDADNTYPAEAIPTMITLLERHDLVRGVRQASKATMPLVNRLGNKIFDTALKIVHDLEGGDHLTGLYGLRREALEVIQFSADGFDLEVEIGIKARAHRLRAAALPIDYRERLGEKKLNAWRDGWRILRRVLSMAILYNPGLTFVLPGVLLWSLASLLMFVTSRAAGVISYAGLAPHGFIVGALTAAAGFQLIVFGIAAALYGTANGVPQRPWLRSLSSHGIRHGMATMGAICALVGLGLFTFLVGQWMITGTAFHDTSGLVLAGVLLSWGVLGMLTGSFLSLFAGRSAQIPAGRGAPALPSHDLQ